MPLHQCPCCDYFSLHTRGEYDICKVCFWEDDGIDVDEPDEYSGPNHMTLREGRQNFLQVGACHVSSLKHVMHVDDRLWLRYRSRALKT